MANQPLFPGVNYRLGPTRQLPLSGQYVTQLMDVVKRTDPNLTIDITSAGQVQQGQEGPRTGSTRHDVDHTGHGHTSDLVLVRDGKPIRPMDDQELYARFLQNAAAAGFTGIGHYDWGVHVGGGSKAMWGPSTGGGSINPVFAQAIENGWKGNWAAGTLPPSPTGPQPDAPKPRAPDATATPMNPSGAAFSFEGVVKAGAGFTTVTGSDGLQYTFQGPRNWRNNNPGNIEFGDFARSMGAVGTDGRFAVFPTYEAGREAKRSLLFESEKYQGMSIAGAISRYAPEEDGNDTARYISTVAGVLGVPANTPLSQLSEAQQASLMTAMEEFEGYKPGQVLRNGQPVSIDLKSTFNPRNGQSAQVVNSQFSMAAGNHSVDIGQVTASNPYTMGEVAAQQREAQTLAEANKTSIVDLAVTAIEQEQVIPWLLKGNEKFLPDAGYLFDAKTATKDIPQEYWNRFDHSQSQAETDYIREGILQSMQADAKLAEAGWGGVGLRIAAGVLDPAAWAAGVGIALTTAGTGVPAYLATKFGRAGIIAANAASGMAGAAIPEAVIAAKKPTYDSSDFAIAVGSGLILGGAFGAFTRNADEAARIEQMGKSIAMGEGNLLAPKRSSAGAAQASVREDLRADASDLVRDLDDSVAPKAFAGNLRWDLAARLKSSENGYVRALGNILVEDGTRNADGLTPFSVSEQARKLTQQAEVRWKASFDSNFKTYAERLEIKRSDMRQARTAFAKTVAESVRNRNPMATYDPEIKAAGNEFRAMMAHWRQLAANPGILDGTTRRAVRGFDKFEDNAFYVPRVFDLGAVQDALNKYGHETLAKFVGRAMKEVNEDLSDEMAEKFGKGYIKKLHSLSAGDLQKNSRALSGEDMEGLKELLRDGTDLNDVELDELLLGLKPKKSNGESPHAKKRLFLDEMFEAKLERIDSTHDVGGDTFRVSDLFMNDADDLMQMYSRQMAGRIAMARARIENPKWQPGDESPRYLLDGITSDSEWEIEMAKLRSVGDTTGTNSHLKADMERLNFAYNQIVGRPVWDEQTGYAQGLRMLRDYNFMRVMNQVGFAQVAELGNVMWQTGLRATFTNMPAWKAMWRNAKTGKIDDTLAQEWEDITGLGADWLRHSDMRRIDGFEQPMQGYKGNKTIEKVDDLQQRGVRAVTAISGMAPINTALQRLTGRAIFNKFANIALDGGTLSAAQMRRMKGLGLSEEMLGRISSQIKTSATFEGKRLKAMNFAQWDDQEALAAFENGVFRMARTIVQENDIGNMAMWMSKPTAKTLLQFRSFMLASWSKQFMNGLNHLDFTTFASFATTAFLGSMTYTLREYLNSIGRPDQQEYLAERLSPQRLVTSGLQNSSWMGIMAPIADTAWTRTTGLDPLFDGRNTQQSSDAFLGNPSVGLIDSLLNVPGAIRNGITGEFSEADARKLKTIMAFQNAMGVVQLFNLTAGNLPD